MQAFQKHLKAMFDADMKARKLQKKAEQLLKKQQKAAEEKMEKRIEQKPLSDFTGIDDSRSAVSARLPDSTGILAQISALQSSSGFTDRLMDRLEYLAEYCKGVWSRFRTKDE